MEIVATTVQTPHETLFTQKSSDAVKISLKEISKEDYVQISELIAAVGLPKIISILQPSSSAEINSQNFIVTLESNERLPNLNPSQKINRIYRILQDNGEEQFPPCLILSIPYASG